MEKKNFFFWALPELPNPPPTPQFGQLGPLFSEVKIQDLKVSLELKILYNILYICNLKTVKSNARKKTFFFHWCLPLVLILIFLEGKRGAFNSIRLQNDANWDFTLHKIICIWFLDALASLDFKLSESQWVIFFTASASKGLSDLFCMFYMQKSD